MLLVTAAFMASGTLLADMVSTGVMELIGQNRVTVLYGDRPASLIASGNPKVFKAPFRGYIVSVRSDGEASRHLTVTINGVPITRKNVFEAGDIIEVYGAPNNGAAEDRIGLEVGVWP